MEEILPTGQRAVAVHMFSYDFVVAPGQAVAIPLLVCNQGNLQQAFTVGWQNPGGEVIFEPEAAQSVRVPPGEVGLVESVARPRIRPFLGGPVSRPFTARIQAPDHQSRNPSGEVVTWGLLPGWVVPALLVVIWRQLPCWSSLWDANRRALDHVT